MRDQERRSSEIHAENHLDPDKLVDGWSPAILISPEELERFNAYDPSKQLNPREAWNSKLAFARKYGTKDLQEKIESQYDDWRTDELNRATGSGLPTRDEIRNIAQRRLDRRASEARRETGW